MGAVMAFAGTSAAADEPEPAPDQSKVDDPCHIAPDNIVLLSSSREGKESFLGLFELRLNTFADVTKPFVAAGTRSKRLFRVDYPSASFEFRDLTGAWHDEPFVLAGSFSAPPDQLTVAHGGGKARIAVQLPGPDIAAQAIEWRLVLRSANNDQCLRSIPFRVVQSRGPVRGFTSRPIPEQLSREQSALPDKPTCQ